MTVVAKREELPRYQVGPYFLTVVRFGSPTDDPGLNCVEMGYVREDAIQIKKLAWHPTGDAS